MLNPQEQQLITAIQKGFPLSPRPFHEIGLTIGLSETEVLQALQALQTKGVIKRTGIVVRHHELGYQANAMVVWDLPEEILPTVGTQVTAFDFVSLCYVRKRCPPAWNYNFYCMIHGQKREETLQRAELLTQASELKSFPRQILFSRRRFKQCGAQYFNTNNAT